MATKRSEAFTFSFLKRKSKESHVATIFSYKKCYP